MPLHDPLQRLCLTTVSVVFVGAGLVLGAGAARADCQTDFMTLRQDVEEKGKALQAAGKAKAPPQTLCPLFRSITTAQGKMAKFLADNKDWCQIPEEAIQSAQAENKKIAGMRDKICAAAASGVGPGGGPAQPPPQSSISSALGITTGYSVSPKGGGSVFDTLSGNALK